MKPPKQPGMKEISFWVPEALYDKMKQIAEARARTLQQPKVPMCWLELEAFEYFVKSVDPLSGLLRRMPPPSSWGIVFPSVCDQIDVNQFSDDAGLFQALDGISMLMTWVDQSDLHCVHASRALTDYVGYPLDKFLKLGWKDLIHPDDQMRTYRRCEECFKDRQPFHLVYRVRRNDGQYAWIVDNVQPRQRPDGCFGGYIGTMYEVGTTNYGPPESYISEAEARELRMVEFLQNCTNAMTVPPRRRRRTKRPRAHDVDLIVYEAKHHGSDDGIK